MKKIATISLVFITVLAQAHQNHKGVKENTAAQPTTQTTNPRPYFRNYTGVATISQKEIMEMDTIKVHSKDANASAAEFTVVSFEVSIVITGKAGKKNLHSVCKGNLVSSEAKGQLKQAVSGATVYVDNVKATDSKGKAIKVSGITFNVN